MKKFLLGILIFFNCLGLFAQRIHEFSMDKNAFSQELENYFSNYKNKESQKLLKEFNRYIFSSTLSPDQFRSVILASNKLLQAKARPIPHYQNFIQSLLAFEETQHQTESFENWLEGVLQLLSKQNTSIEAINRFFQTSRIYLQENLLYKSASIKWGLEKDSSYFKSTEKGPGIYVESADIFYKVKNETQYIRNTTGIFYPINNTWEGNEGEINWEFWQKKGQEVFAKLHTYQIIVNKSVYRIDSVQLFDKRRFNHPIWGYLEDQLLTGRSRLEAGYPRFTSFAKDHHIKNMIESMDYSGGYAIHGNRFIGFGDAYQEAQILVYYKNRALIRLKSNKFQLKSNVLSSENTKTSVFLEQDSVYHPGLSFRYNDNNKELRFIRSEKEMGNSIFYDYYHKFDIDAKMFRWKLGEDIIQISSLPGYSEYESHFESRHFFSMQKYFEIELKDKEHPLLGIRNCRNKFQSEQFTNEDLALVMDMPIDLINQMLLKLSFQGFVDYNQETGLIKIRQKTYDYIASYTKVKDYDILSFTSITRSPQVNALLNLTDLSLSVFGVGKIELQRKGSISRDYDDIIVSFFPYQNKIVIDKNRKIIFDGELVAGSFDMIGNNFKFDYENFKVDLDTIESLEINMHDSDLNKYGKRQLFRIKSLLEDVSGELIIDKTDNKSGNEPNPEYPVFKSKTKSYVYYDDLKTLGGIYERDSVYFEIDSFAIDSLGYLNAANGITLKGRLISGGILPPIEASLELQADGSLGFETVKSPDDGFPIYQGKARFYNDINMSGEGLKASGKFVFGNTEVWAKNFLFKPGQMEVLADKVIVHSASGEQEFPEITNSNVLVSFKASENQLKLKNTETPFKIYDNGLFDGELILNEKQVKGNGKLMYEGFVLSSNDFSLKQRSFIGKTADFILHDGNNQSRDYAFISRNSDIEINLDEGWGLFSANQTNSRLQFPKNQFISTLGNFTWDMKKENISIAHSKLISIHPKQDSLSFFAEHTLFDYKKHILKAEGVDSIELADMLVFPDNSSLSVEENASIPLLKNARMSVKDTSMNHKFSNALIDIKGKYNFQASADYYYIDKAGRPFKVKFDQIQVSADRKCIGNGSISIEDEFVLSPWFDFNGNVNFRSDQALLSFDGYLSFIHNCENFSSQWIKFTADINPDSISIPISSEMINPKKQKLYTSLFMKRNEGKIYSSFLGLRNNYSDIPLINTSGALYYDEVHSQFKIASPKRLEDPFYPGELISFDRDRCIIEGQGKLSMGVELGQVKLNSSGRIYHDLQTDSVYTEALGLLDFFFSEKALDHVANKIIRKSELPAVNIGTDKYKQGMYHLIPEADAQKLFEDLGIFGRTRKVPESLEKSFFFNRLEMAWDAKESSFVSIGKLGIGNILDKSLNKYVDGFLELTKNRAGDILNLYIELDEKTWYFFSYQRGVMRAYASDRRFNDILRDVKAKNRSMDIDQGPTYTFVLGQQRTALNYIRKFKDKYRN